MVSLAAVGKDCPDLLVGHRGHNYLMEVKRPPGPKGGMSEDGQKLSPGQERFRREWRGRPVVVVRSPSEALQALGLMPLKIP